MSADRVVEKALDLSRADDAIVIVEESDTVNLRWANNTLTTNGSAHDRRVTVISVVGSAVGVRSATAPDDAGLAELVAAAERAAAEGEPADDAMPLVTGAAASGFTDPAEHTTPAVFDTFARELGEAFVAAQSRSELLYGFAQHDVTTTWLGTSTGVRLRHAQPTGSVEWNAKNGRPGGSVWSAQATRDFADVDVAGTVADLATRLSWTERQVALEAGRYETILPPTSVADLMLFLTWSAGGRDTDEGRTVFSRAGGGTRVGEAFGPAGMRMYSDPHDAALACLPFVVAHQSSSLSSVFDNGQPLAATDWFADGKLASLIDTRAQAAKSGRPVAPLVDNLVLEGGPGSSASLEEMIAATDRGLLLTSMWYIREVDPQTLLLTGLTRDGVFLIEGGEVVGAVNNFRFNESPVDVLGRVSEVGASVPCLPREWADWFTLARMPCLRVPEFNMSSVSPAS